jgi:hypothetical protein
MMFIYVCVVQVLLHHGHVEAVLSDKNPLLGVIIYDSCRDDPKEYIKVRRRHSSQTRILC